MITLAVLSIFIFLAAQGAAPLNMEFVHIEPGTFMMGCADEDTACDPDEIPAHPVRITRPFEIGKYEVTQAQWRTVMNSDPSNFKGDTLPVERVTWGAVQQFLERMNARNDGYRYRLPTEAEWEYAARAGSTGVHLGEVDQVAWYMENSEEMTHPVGQKQPNAWGLYDVQGNVYEFVQDFYANYPDEPAEDPVGPEEGSDRVPRGGSWMSAARGVRLSNRNLIEPPMANVNIGFRCVREAAR